MTLDQKLRTMPRPEAVSFINSIYEEAGRLVTSTDLSFVARTFNMTKGLMGLVLGKEFREAAHSLTEEAAIFFKEEQARLHNENIQRVTEYILSKIREQQLYYPGDGERFRALQEHLEERLESVMALYEERSRSPDFGFVGRFYKCIAVGALVGYLSKKPLLPILTDDSNPPFGFAVITVATFAGFGTLAAVVRTFYIEENADTLFREKLEALGQNALQAFYTPQ